MSKGLIPILLLLASCASVQQRKIETLSKVVYAENAAIKAKRFDLVQKYNADAVKLVAPPKDAVKIDAIQNFVVVPAEDSGVKTISLDSEEGKTLIASNPAIAKQVLKENADAGKVDSQTTKVLQEEQKELTKSKSSWFHLPFFFGISGILLVIGGIVLICFFPALLPIVINIFNLIASVVGRVISSIASLFKK